MNTRYSKLALAFLFLILVVPPVVADEHEDEWEQLNAQALVTSQAGIYDLAAKLVEKQLAIAEKHLPSRVAESLNNLAGLYRAQGKYALAEPLFKRALAIDEKALGPDHPDVAQSLNNLATLYQAQGKYAEAEPLYKRSLAINEKARDPLAATRPLAEATRNSSARGSLPAARPTSTRLAPRTTRVPGSLSTGRPRRPMRP